MPDPSPRYLLLRVERTVREGSARPIGVFPSLDDAKHAAAEQPHQPAATWRRGDIDGVWYRTDWTGQGFAIHLVHDPPDRASDRPDP
jgi:hypothetical protein